MREGKSHESCTHDVQIYEIANSKLGPIKLIDTEGLNDTGVKSNDYNSLMKIFIAFYDNNIVNVDAILYFSPANGERFHYDKNMNLFCKIFETNLDEIKQNSVIVFTKFNKICEDDKDEAIERAVRISRETKLPFILWDSCTHLFDQFDKLKKFLESSKKYEFPFHRLQAEIKAIAAALQDNDKILVNPAKRTSHIENNNYMDFTHKESKSSAGIWDVFSFGITLALADISDQEKFYLSVKFPESSEYKSVENKKLNILNTNVLAEYKINKHEFTQDVSNTFANFCSKIHFPPTLNGHASITYRVKYSYSYDTVESDGPPRYQARPIENYMLEAKDKFIDQKKKDKKNNNL